MDMSCMNPRICSRRPGQRNLLPVQNFDRFLNFLLNCQRVLLHLEPTVTGSFITNLEEITVHPANLIQPDQFAELLD